MSLCLFIADSVHYANKFISRPGKSGEYGNVIENLTCLWEISCSNTINFENFLDNKKLALVQIDFECNMSHCLAFKR